MHAPASRQCNKRIERSTGVGQMPVATILPPAVAIYFPTATAIQADSR